MNIQLLIDSIVRQTTVLIAQLATSGGARAPLAHVANQVFLDLAHELDEQGVSRKVGADMFGMALRTYQRKVQRLTESTTDRGRSLWEAVFAFLEERRIATRPEILERFHRDDEVLVRGVLHDLSESGLVFAAGSGPGAVYRVATREDLTHVRDDGSSAAPSLDAMVWALVYREGPVALEQLTRLLSGAPDAVIASVARLEQAGRIQRDSRDCYSCQELVLQYGSSIGWEAAVWDHFQAVVRTICGKLRLDQTSRQMDTTGGSTYTFVIWDGHPMAEDALEGLARFRDHSDELRSRIDEYNKKHGVPARHRKVVAYGGQYVMDEEPLE